jgi:hypothetical protein
VCSCPPYPHPIEVEEISLDTPTDDHQHWQVKIDLVTVELTSSEFIYVPQDRRLGITLSFGADHENETSYQITMPACNTGQIAILNLFEDSNSPHSQPWEITQSLQSLLHKNVNFNVLDETVGEINFDGAVSLIEVIERHRLGKSATLKISKRLEDLFDETLLVTVTLNCHITQAKEAEEEAAAAGDNRPLCTGTCKSDEEDAIPNIDELLPSSSSFSSFSLSSFKGLEPSSASGSGSDSSARRRPSLLYSVQPEYLHEVTDYMFEIKPKLQLQPEAANAIIKASIEDVAILLGYQVTQQPSSTHSKTSTMMPIDYFLLSLSLLLLLLYK